MTDSSLPLAITMGVLTNWGIDPRRADVSALPVSGSSGSPVWLVRPRGTSDAVVLKAFAAGTPRHRAAWVHGLMRHLSAAGIREVPALVSARDGDTLVTDAEGVHWELARFVPGIATAEPSAAEAAHAATTLARVHVAAATLPGTIPAHGPSPGIVTRIERARLLLARPWQARLSRGTSGPLADRQRRAIEAFARYDGTAALTRVTRFRPPEIVIQAVIRDVWSDHVLYALDRPATVAGIVDYHAAGVDTPATDLARLLGSWRGEAVGGLVAGWPAALAAYEAVRPLTVAERSLVPWLHATGVVFGLDNWFRWTIEEGRQFAGVHAVLDRIERLSARLPAALEWLGTSPGNPV
jgi:Ser/Thr protein kinase RdoA (MazF antagonist)